MVLKKVCQVLGFLLLIGVLFLMLCVSSYSPGDPDGNSYVSHGQVTIQNRTGAVGAVLADWALQAFGSTVYLLAGLAGVAAWYLLRGRLITVVAVAWRGLLCLAAVSAAAHLMFTRDPIFGTAIFVGGLLADLSVENLSRPGAYAVFGLVALGALCIGGEHPIRTALWRGLRAVGHWSWVLMRAVRRGLVWAASVVRRTEAVARRLSRAVARQRQSDASPPSYVPQPEVDEPIAHYAACPVDTLPVPHQVAVAVDSIVPSTRQGQALPAPSSEASRRQQQPVVPAPPAVRRQHRATNILPSLDLLDAPAAPHRGHSAEELDAQARFLEQKLREFGVEGEVVQVLPGPVITMYEFAPAAGVKVNKIVNLQDDLALVMQAMSVRVVAPIPGKAVVGIEIPHQRREVVRLRDLLDSEEFHTSMSKLSLALGKDILGRP